MEMTMEMEMAMEMAMMMVVTMMVVMMSRARPGTCSEHLASGRVHW